MSNILVANVQKCLDLHEKKDVAALQQGLFEFYSAINKRGGGRDIINYPNKEQLSECFTLMIAYDWTGDSDIMEVCAENGFYCIIEYINSIHTQGEQMLGSFDLFLHLFYSKQHLIPKVKDILLKAQMRNESVFDRNDYNNGAEYVINQFLFLSAQIIKPMIVQDKDFVTNQFMFFPTQVMQSILSKNDFISTNNETKRYFTNTLNDRTYYNLRPEEIFMKAKFVSKIIGSILEDM